MRNATTVAAFLWSMAILGIVYAEPAQVVLAPGSTTVTSGNTLMVTCLGYGSPPPTITWRKGGRLLTNESDSQTNVYNSFLAESGVTLSRSVLEICSVNLADEGEYSCSAVNSFGNDSVSFELFVNVQSQVLLAPGNISVVSGDTADLACLAYGIPLPNITWTKDGVPLNNNSITDRITTYEGVITEGGVALARSFLQICSLQPSDDGQYSCVADNDIGNATTSNFELIVSVPAQVLQAPGSITEISGNTVHVECRAYGIPRPNITWTKGGVPLSNNSDANRITIYEGNITGSGITLVLKIDSVHLSDGGAYSCVADNGIGNATSEFEIIIPVHCLAIEDDPLDPNFPSISLSWPETDIASSHSLPCPCLNNTGRYATRSCGGNATSGAKWNPVDFSRCNFTVTGSFSITLQLCELPGLPPEQRAEALATITSMDDIQADDVSLAADAIKNLTAAAITNERVRGQYLESIDNLVQADADVIAESQERTQSSTRLLDSLTNFSNKLVITNATTATFTQRTFAIRANDINASSFQGETFSVNLGSVEDTMGISGAIREETIETASGNMTYLNRTASVRVPRSVFQELGQAGDQQRLSYAVFLRDTLFQSSDQNQSNLTVGSVIVAVTVNGTSVGGNLSTPITVTFQASELAGNATSITCGLWDRQTNGGRGVWITESCPQNSTTSESSRGSTPQNDSSEMEAQTVTAHYSQPGHFGLLLDLTRNFVSPPPHVYGVVLQSFSYVGLAISLLCLSVFIITHLASRKLRKKEHEQILINLSFALMGLYLVFILGANTAPIPPLCGISAALLQYFLLVFFAWTTAEAFYLYQKLVKVLGVKQRSRLVLKIGLIVWLVPLVIVVVCAAPGYKFYYQESKSGFCRSWGIPFYIGLIAPFIILYILNWIAFVLVMISVCKHSYKKTGSTAKQDTFAFVRKNATIAFSLAVLFGLGWGFGLAASGTPSKEATFVFQLLFTIFVGCQGLLIFILHGIRKEEARNEWKKWFSTATSKTYELYSGVSRSASTAPLSQHTESQPTSPSSSTYDMQTLSKSGTLPTEVSSETDFKTGIDDEKGESLSETNIIESTGVSGHGPPRKRSLIQAAVDSIKIPGKHGKYDMLKASETPPPQRKIALQSVAEAPEGTTEDRSDDEKETGITEGLLDASAPSKQHARRVSAPEPRVTTDAASSESKQARKPRRSWLPPFKGRSGQYDLISHESLPIRTERYKKKQSGSKLAKSLYELEDEEKEAEEAKPLPYDTTAAHTSDANGSEK